MADSLVHRATSDQLIGPDWAMNMEICDILNRDPGQAKDAVKGLKKRLVHKSPKVQFLALTLLETIVKNCGDIVHMHVAERDLPHEMVKLSRKKCDLHVKEKVLALIDTWQEAFGGPRARYPQYFAAYHELLRAGAVFPQRAERSAPYFNTQVLPAGTYPAASARSSDFQREDAESAGTEPPALTLSEIQNARGIMDVLAEMLNALDPANREGVRQEVIVDLVSQCRNYKQRVVHLVNSTVDEELLSQGLTLNDDLQRVLGRHDAIAAGIPFREDNSNKSKDKEKEKETEKPKQRSLQQLVDIEDATTSNPTSTNDEDRVSGASTGDNPPFRQLLLPGPEGSNGPAAATSSKPEPTMDLLSFDVDTPEPAAANGTSLALVPVTDPFSASNANSNAASNPGDLLALVEMYPQSNSAPATDPNANLMGSQPFGLNAAQSPVQPQQQVPLHPGIYANGAATPNSMVNHVATPLDQALPQLNQPGLPWNGQMVQQGMTPHSPTAEYNDNQGEFPLPPWETQLDQSSQTAAQPGGMQMTTLAGPIPTGQVGLTMQPQSPMQMGQMPMQNGQPGFLPQQQLVQGAQFPGMQYQQGPTGQYGPPGQYGMYHQQMAMYGGQMMGYGYMQPAQDASQYYGQMGQMYGYGAGMGSTNDLSQRMYGLSLQDKTGGYACGAGTGLSYSNSTPMVPSSRPAKPEDKLFGDLVSFAKSKPK